MDVHLTSATFFSEKEKVLLNDALNLLQEAINTTIFKEMLINHTYNGRREFVDNYIFRNRERIYMTNEEVYEHFMSGSETHAPEADHKMNLILEAWERKRCTSTVGKTDMVSGRIATYKCWLERFEPYNYAAHLAHEYCHALGFWHNRRRTASGSVPYAVGKYIEQIAGGLALAKRVQSLSEIEIVAKGNKQNFI